MPIQVGNGPQRRTTLTEVARNPKTLAIRAVGRPCYRGDSPLFLLIFLEPAQQVRHAGDRSRVGEKQRGPDQLSVIGVDRHMVGDPFKPCSFNADASVPRAVSQFVEQIG